MVVVPEHHAQSPRTDVCLCTGLKAVNAQYDVVMTAKQVLQLERAGLRAQLSAAHPATAQRLRSEVETLQERVRQLSATEARTRRNKSCSLFTPLL